MQGGDVAKPDLPGVITARIMEALVDGYEIAFADPEAESAVSAPDAVKFTMRRALGRKWRHVAEERIKTVEPTIPLGSRFWALSTEERQSITALFERDDVRGLITQLKGRSDDTAVRVVDAAYWIKGCSSLGRLRYSVLVEIVDGARDAFCLMDVKEALRAAAPRAKGIKMPKDDAVRVVTGARALSPSLGERMIAAKIMETSVFVRELMPQDLKLDIDRLTPEQATKAARYLAWVVGKAHASQMDSAIRRDWIKELQRNRTAALDAPSWLWTSVVELVAYHEAGYLNHCHAYALSSDLVLEPEMVGE